MKEFTDFLAFVINIVYRTKVFFEKFKRINLYHRLVFMASKTFPSSKLALPSQRISLFPGQQVKTWDHRIVARHTRIPEIFPQKINYQVRAVPTGNAYVCDGSRKTSGCIFNIWSAWSHITAAKLILRISCSWTVRNREKSVKLLIDCQNRHLRGVNEWGWPPFS